MSTIAAVATPQGNGAIGIVRISGPEALSLLTKIVLPSALSFDHFRPWVMHRGRFQAEDGSFLDDVLGVYMPAPKTYSGEDMAEIHCHGNPLILQSVLARLFQLGARPAQRGEFTKRAFLNGRLDLSQAEAVGELVGAVSRTALADSVQRLCGHLSQKMADLRGRVDALRAELAVACDFPDDEVECLERSRFLEDLSGLQRALEALLAGSKRGRLMQEGARVVLAGAVNAGKSSLMNALLGRERALVTEVAGTTRDFLEEFCDLDGLPVRLIDTAGLHAQSQDPVELLGIARGQACLEHCDAIVLVFDQSRWQQKPAAASCPDSDYAEILSNYAQTPKLLVWNKRDLVAAGFDLPCWAKDYDNCFVSCLNGQGLDELARRLHDLLLGSAEPASEHVSCNVRQALALSKAGKELSALICDVRANVPYDLCAVRLDLLAEMLGEVIGVSTPDEVLNAVFDRFCIGK
ncbi:MAG: tRNA uridine-5-carboxymethylaminomethyl(34) synthesis GTPase MnmE [Desulfovibrio sp.]|nr:tRNA uridine-5-carboxymethylaminomethyl(34) synthesis GTPase MnmE [Desulfovibrio sp.]